MDTYKYIILVAMIFCHIVDDYYSQGILASMKQKEWWVKNAPDKQYKYDYLIALFMHSFSWAFCIMSAPTLCTIIFGGTLYPVVFAANIVIHMVVDDLKANRRKINLIEDQVLHIIQIVLTWSVVV